MVSRITQNDCFGRPTIIRWRVGETVRAARWSDSGGWVFILSRNMDDMRHKYGWRVSRFDSSGEASGHSYGETAEEAVNHGVWGNAELMEVTEA